MSYQHSFSDVSPSAHLWGRSVQSNERTFWSPVWFDSELNLAWEDVLIHNRLLPDQTYWNSIIEHSRSFSSTVPSATLWQGICIDDVSLQWTRTEHSILIEITYLFFLLKTSAFLAPYEQLCFALRMNIYLILVSVEKQRSSLPTFCHFIKKDEDPNQCKLESFSPAWLTCWLFFIGDIVKISHEIHFNWGPNNPRGILMSLLELHEDTVMSIFFFLHNQSNLL